MCGLPCGTIAQYEDSASTTPIHISVAWESSNWPGGVLSLFFGAKLSCNIFTFILTNSMKAAKLRKRVRSASYQTTQPRPLSVFKLSKPHCFSDSPPPHTPECFSRGPGTWYTLPNKTQDHQPIQEIQEPGETHPNSSGLSKEVDGHKRSLILSMFQFLPEFR